MPLDDLNLTRKGPAQMDRVIVNPGRVRAPEASNESGEFLQQISQLSGTVGNILAKRGAEKRQLEEQRMTSEARIAAYDPEGHQRGLASGIYKEWDSEKWPILVDGYKAESDSVKFDEKFASFDPSQGPEAAEALISEQQATASANSSPAYQAVILPQIAQRAGQLRARVNQHRLQIQKEETVLNYTAGTNAALTSAVESGASAEQVYATLNERIDVAVHHGMSRADAATGIMKSVQALVAEEPALADVMNNYEIPGIGRLGDVAPGAIDDVAAAAVKARRTEQRALRAEYRAERADASKEAQRRVWNAVYKGEEPSPDDIQMGSYADPNFMLDVEKASRSQGLLGDIDPDYDLYTQFRVKSLIPGGLTNQELFDNRNKFLPEQYDRLATAIASHTKANKGKGPLDDQVFKTTLAPVTKLAETFRLPANALENIDIGVRASYREAERRAIQQVNDVMTSQWAEIHASGAKPEEIALAASRLREAAVAELQSAVANVRFDPRFNEVVSGTTRTQMPPPEAKATFDGVPGSMAVFARIPSWSGSTPPVEGVPPRVLPSQVREMLLLAVEGSPLPEGGAELLQDIRIQLALPPNLTNLAILTALDVHYNGIDAPAGEAASPAAPEKPEGFFQRMNRLGPQTGPGFSRLPGQ